MVRDASERDAEACAAIYAPYVTDTAISFETEPPDSAAMAERRAEQQPQQNFGMQRHTPRRLLFVIVGGIQHFEIT